MLRVYAAILFPNKITPPILCIEFRWLTPRQHTCRWFIRSFEWLKLSRIMISCVSIGWESSVPHYFDLTLLIMFMSLVNSLQLHELLTLLFFGYHDNHATCALFLTHISTSTLGLLWCSLGRWYHRMSLQYRVLCLSQIIIVFLKGQKSRDCVLFWVRKLSIGLWLIHLFSWFNYGYFI